jgi:hypothetical protein
MKNSRIKNQKLLITFISVYYDYSTLLVVIIVSVLLYLIYEFNLLIGLYV